MEIRDRSVIITGGGTGIGAAIAANLCAAGARVMIAGRREDRLDRTAATLAARGGTIAYRRTNIADAAECGALVEVATSIHGPIDILVNNAGVLSHGKSIAEHSAADWDDTMAINLRAAFLLSVAVLPGMKERRRGFILMISSDSGIHYFQNQVIYGLTKHGLNDLAQYILAEYQTYGIHAAALCPGLTDTEMGLSLNPTARQNVLRTEDVAAWARWVITQPESMNVARPLVLSPMFSPMAPPTDTNGGPS